MSPSPSVRRHSNPPATLENLSPRRRAALNALNDALPLLLLAMVLLFASRLLILSHQEALTLKSAAHPFAAALARFRNGVSLSATSPVFDLLLHAWLRATGVTSAILRAPSGIFFLAGMWFLSCAANFWGDEFTGNTLLWLAAIWPYAFHYGVQATRYSLAFLLIGAATWACLRLTDSSRFADWAMFCGLSLLLVYVTYVGWALLVLLGIEHLLRNRSRARATALRLLGAASFLALAYAPSWSAFARVIHDRANVQATWRALLVNAGFNIYTLFVSESVAPWFWRFGVPAALAIATVLVLAFIHLRWEVRRFFLLGALLMLVMDLGGALQPPRLLLVAPFFLLPVAVAFNATKKTTLRRSMLVALLVASGIGWYGTFARRYYATGSFAEPWPGLAAETAGALQQAGSVISNSQPFFVYLTYDLGGPTSAGDQALSFFPELPSNGHVWSADSWQAAGRPLSPYMIWIDALSDSSGSQPMQAASNVLDQRCGGRVSRFLVRNPAFPWEERYVPNSAPSPWRIEIRQYLCGEFAPKPAPAHPAPVQPNPPPKP